MALPEFTTIVGVDREHLPELAAAWPTWVKWRPEAVSGNVLFAVDEKGDGVNTWHTQVSDFWRREISAICGERDNIKCCYSRSPLDWPQRERMLTALVACVEHVKTPYFLKLDTDTLACGTGPGGKWWDDSWFDGGENGPVIVASPWGYTKPAGHLDKCDEWWESFENDRTLESDRPPRTVIGNIARHPRIISYAMWGRTDWTQRMWALCDGRLPCPSQDTFLWYCAARGGWPIIRANQKRWGWRHCGSSLRRVRERARIALNA